MPPLQCQDRHDDTCTGTVEHRPPLEPSTTSTIRCAGHWSARLELQARLRRDYPDSPVPPAWFDPSDAGERWSDDD